MTVIKPISDLKNKTREIAQIAHEHDGPIFITKDGEGDLVVMSLAHYSKLQMRLDLYNKLAVAQAQKAAGDKGKTLSAVMKDIRKKIDEAS